MPHWLIVLRDAVEASSLAEVGRRVGYSKTTLSQVLSGKYPGDTAAVEQAVCGALMNQRVACPAIGAEIPAHVCQEHQRAKPNTSSPMRIRLYRACRSGCPHSKLRKTP